MTLVKKRALISAAAALALLGGNLLAVPAARAADVSAPEALANSESSAEAPTQVPSEGQAHAGTDIAPPADSSETVETPAPGSKDSVTPTEESSLSTTDASDSQTPASTATRPQAANMAGNNPSNSGNAATALEKAIDVRIDKGSANWQFNQSFRDYIGLTNETLDRVGREHNTLMWNIRGTEQIFNTKNPTQVRFDGQVEWQKHHGTLRVKLSNPSLDFATKKLYVDAYTKGALAGGQSDERPAASPAGYGRPGVRGQGRLHRHSLLPPTHHRIGTEHLRFLRG